MSEHNEAKPMTDEITFDFACRDDCLDQMVPSDLRQLVAERDRLRMWADYERCFASALMRRLGFQETERGARPSHWIGRAYAEIKRLRAELAELEAQEPVAWVLLDANGEMYWGETCIWQARQDASEEADCLCDDTDQVFFPTPLYRCPRGASAQRGGE